MVFFPYGPESGTLTVLSDKNFTLDMYGRGILSKLYEGVPFDKGIQRLRILFFFLGNELGLF